jgi:hypothetical protein
MSDVRCFFQIQFQLHLVGCFQPHENILWQTKTNDASPL